MAASLLLGVIWAVWHIPLFLTGDQHWSDLVLVVFATIVFTWLFQNALERAHRDGHARDEQRRLR